MAGTRNYLHLRGVRDWQFHAVYGCGIGTSAGTGRGDVQMEAMVAGAMARHALERRHRQHMGWAWGRIR